MLTVPVPLRVTFAAPITNSVGTPVEFSEIVPELLIALPLTVSCVSLPKLKVSVLPRVRSAVPAPMIFSVTIEFAVLMHVFVLLVGTPALQLPGTFQFPVAAPVQLVSHCANAESGHKPTTSNSSQNPRCPLFFCVSDSLPRKCVRIWVLLRREWVIVPQRQVTGMLIPPEVASKRHRPTSSLIGSG